MPPKLRLAYFSPLPPTRSGIADYSRLLLPHLAQEADVTLFTDTSPQVERDEWWPTVPIYPLQDYAKRRWEFDVALYQIGNSRHHAGIYHLATRHPGIVILHDFNLHHFIADTTMGFGNYPAHTRELAYELGIDGVTLARRIRWQGTPHPLFTLPLNQRILDSSLGVLVHSHFVQKLVTEKSAHPCHTIPMIGLPIIRLPPSSSLPAPNRSANMPANSIVIGLFGQVTAAKQAPELLKAMASLLPAFPELHLLIAGETHPEVKLDEIIAGNCLDKQVTKMGYVADFDEFLAWMASIDILVNLRHPTVGETSVTALWGMALGLPVIVNDNGWYGELPDEVCLKVPALDTTALQTALKNLITSAKNRKHIGERAKKYVQENHSPQQVTKAYQQAIQQIMEQVLA